MKLWAVYSPNGHLCRNSIRAKKWVAEWDFVEAVNVAGKQAAWTEAMRDGYRCKRITVTVEGES